MSIKNDAAAVSFSVNVVHVIKSLVQTIALLVCLEKSEALQNTQD